MKNLKLKEGYYVDSWYGEITPIFYTIVDDIGLVSETKILLFNSDSDLIDLLYEHKKSNIHDDLKSAEIQSKRFMENRIISLKERIKSHEKDIKELTQKLNK